MCRQSTGLDENVFLPNFGKGKKSEKDKQKKVKVH